MKPARHGVYDFWTDDAAAKAGKARSAHVLTHRKGGDAIWNMLSEYGKQMLVVNVPMTYPPGAVNGIMVSGYTMPGAHVDFTHPSTFKGELYRAVPGYQIDLDVALREHLHVTGKFASALKARVSTLHYNKEYRTRYGKRRRRSRVYNGEVTVKAVAVFCKGRQ